MQDFMNEHFLLETATAQRLYHDYAVPMPIIDYHCHINPAEILENRRFSNLTQAWLAGDHYKWRLLRANGVAEDYITGEASDREKFQKFAETLPRCIGNPVYHWAHLELKRYFGTDLVLNGDTAQEIWELTSEALPQEALRVRSIIAHSRVQAIGTTDDPADDLSAHQQLSADPTNPVIVVPTLRPDQAVNIENPGFGEYVAKLACFCNTTIQTLDDLKQALLARLDYFKAQDCRASDHGLTDMVYLPADKQTVAAIFQKALAAQALSPTEVAQYKTDLLLFFGRELAARNLIMQIHYGTLRNTNAQMFHTLGPDTGFDAIGAGGNIAAIASFLSALAQENKLPRTILYSLNPNDNAALDAICGCFQDDSSAGKVQHGSAWWFNDTKSGMEAQLLSLASCGILGNFVGMLTDSRSFLSYTRHEYFRRILCNLLGSLVEKGEYPADWPTLGVLVKDISYRNTARYFGFDVLV